MSDPAPSATKRVLGWVAVAALAIILVAIVLGGSRIVNAGSADDDAYVVLAGETVDETVVVAASTVEIDGTVDGDVIAWARNVVVTGTIRGNLVTFAEDVEIGVEGIVEGTTHCICRDFVLRGEVHGNAYALAQWAIVGRTGSVERDLVVAAALARIEGEVGRDVRLAADDGIVAGEVGRDVRGRVTRVSASAQSRVHGDVRLQVAEPDAVQITDGARIDGVVRIDDVPADSKYRHPSWYVLQVLQLVAAFIVALVLVRVYPPLFTVPLERTRSVALDVGLGLLVLVVTPVLAVLALFTIVGLPLGLVALAAYLLALYLAGIVVGGRIGNAIVRKRPSNSALPLFVGLLVLAVATALPFVGPILALVAIVVGLAIMVRLARQRRHR